MKAFLVLPVVLALGACASYDDYGYDDREYRGRYIVEAPRHYADDRYPNRDQQGYFYDPWYSSAYGYGVWQDPWRSYGNGYGYGSGYGYGNGYGYGYGPRIGLSFGGSRYYGNHGNYGYGPWRGSSQYTPSYRYQQRGLRSGDAAGGLADQVRSGRARDYGDRAPAPAFQSERAPSFERERDSGSQDNSYDSGQQQNRNEGLPQ